MPATSRDTRSTALLLFVAVASSLACTKSAEPPPPASQVHFSNTAAVKVRAARSGEWLLLFETLQPEFLVTMPMRSAAVVGPGSQVMRTFAAPDGWILVDAVAHPSGDVSVASLRVDSTAAYPMRAVVSRFGTDGTVREHELLRLPPPSGAEPPPAFMVSLDRLRLVALGEDLFAIVRWANNSVQAYRIAFEAETLNQRWATWVEPAAPLFSIGIIGGGFDNFHQEDSSSFVYADVDGQASLHVAVASTAEVLPSHDAFFGENLMSQADPANFDFGTAIVTRVDAQGIRTHATLLGLPGRPRQLLNMRVASGSVLLVGRIKTGDEPGSWDGWILSSRAATGAMDYERVVDVQSGDMFWDATALNGGKVLAVGSTNYTQNPVGLSVSDARDALAVVLDPLGNVEERLPLPSGPTGRGNEAMSLSVGEGGEVAIAGVQNAPGSHALVFSDGFLVVRGVDLP